MVAFYSYAVSEFGRLIVYKHTAQGIYSICEVTVSNNMSEECVDCLVDDLIAEYEENLTD